MPVGAQFLSRAPRRYRIWPQVALVLLVFAGSLVALFWNAYAAFREPREMQVRNRLWEASQRMVLAASEAGLEAREFEFENASRESLSHFPHVEGGYYRVDENRFVAYSFPTAEVKKQHRSKHAKRNEPPPKEMPFVRIQSREAAELPPGEFVANVLDVGPSRVAIVTRPVGDHRPARLVAWTMFRLTGPADVDAQMRRYQASLGLALGGMLMSVLLMLNLGRVLSRQWREQNRLRDDLRQSEQLAVLGKLLAGVAHEVRNPLAGIRSTVELWQRLPETTQTEESRAAVLGAVDRLNELVSRLLLFVRTSNEHAPLQVNELLRNNRDLFAAQAANQSVQIQLDLDSDLPFIRGSAGGIQQVVTNLTTNALTAMPAGGILTWNTRLSHDRRGVELVIADTGSGVLDHVRQHLFEPFYTTRAEGTGLGLSLCREIVEQHGGTIELISQPEHRGAAFRVRLPLKGRRTKDSP